jgi:hypothetical protein
MARGVEARIAWFRGHYQGWPARRRGGLCARHTWLSLGIPPIGASDAHAALAKTKAAGNLRQGDPPRGAVVFYKGGRHGHAALSLGKGPHGTMILTTDAHGAGTIGERDLDWPLHAWGHKRAGWAWAWGSRKVPSK